MMFLDCIIAIRSTKNGLDRVFFVVILDSIQ